MASLPHEAAHLPTEHAGLVPPAAQGSAPPPVALATGSSSGSPLPSDLVHEAGRRLSLAMMVVAAVDLVYVLLYFTIWKEHSHLVGEITGSAALVLSIALAWMLRSCPRTQREVLLASAAYEVAITFGFSLTEYWSLGATDHITNLVSWTCVIIAFYPVLVPGRARQVAIGSFLAAGANTVAFVLAYPVRGVPMPPPDVTVSLLIPVYIAAALSLVPARVLSKMGSHLRKARQLGSYHLVEPLGAGGMGEVWRAEHRLLARPAAIKLIKAGGEMSDETRRNLVDRFEREAQATAALESPHTVDLYDFGIAQDGTFYYVMELLRGVSLEQLASRFGPQPPERVAHILLQACDSLGDAHAAGLIHRDIKPANLLVTRRAAMVDYVKVLDFGLVKLAQQDPEDVKLSRAGEVHGTPAYMAPEEATGATAVDERSDLYSLGCVAYWLLTGKMVFDEASSVKMALAHATREPVAPSRVVGAGVIPPDLEALVMRCLAKNPEERPAGAYELARELQLGGWDAAWTPERAEAWWREKLPDLSPPSRARRSSITMSFSARRAAAVELPATTRSSGSRSC